MSGPVFPVPPAPRLATPESDLIRIVDPLGAAIAWFVPGPEVRCVGYLVRAEPTLVSSDVHWRDVVTEATVARRPGKPADGEPIGPSPAWRLETCDPVSCTIARHFEAVAHGEQWMLSASLESGRLALRLCIRNPGHHPIQVGAELRLALAPPAGPLVRRASLVARRKDGDWDADTALPHGPAPISVTVEAGTSGGCEPHTEWHGEALCTVATHSPGSSPPSIEPDHRCDLWVEIGCPAQDPAPS